jgi:tetratricopeptide (TPR) repeat protein
LLGTLARALKNNQEAVVLLRKAQMQYPGDFWLNFDLAERLHKDGWHLEAAGFYRAALAARPDTAVALVNLGGVLEAQKKLDEACDCYRRAIELDPNFAEAHCDLGGVLQERGDFAEALGSLQRGHERGSKRRDWTHPSAAWVSDCERLIEREKQLLDILGGRSRPADARERLEWASLCVQTRRYVAAARLSSEAFESKGKRANDLEAGHRYLAATAAAQAGSARGAAPAH